MHVPVWVKDQRIALTIDTGSQINVLSETALSVLRQRLHLTLPLHTSECSVRGPSAQLLQILGSVSLKIKFFQHARPVNVKFLVMKDFALPSDGILGFPTLKRLRVDIFSEQSYISYRGQPCHALSPPRPLCTLTGSPSPQPSPLPPTPSLSPQQHLSLNACLAQAPVVPLSLADTSTVAPHSVIMLRVRLKQVPDGTDILILSESVRIRGMRLESGIAQVRDGGLASIVALNLTNGTLTLTKGTCLGEALVYPAPVKECDFPQSFFTAALTHDVSADDFSQFSASVSHSLCQPDYPEFQERLFQLLFTHSSAVALPGQPLGCTHLVEHKIELLPGARPLYIPAYRLPHSQREVANRKVQEMMDEGIIEPSTSPWNSPLFLVAKRDGDFRPVVDFRRLNQCTASQRFPLPILTDLLHSLGENNSIFSTLDLMSGFWQVPLAPDSRPLTAFSTPAGHFQYLRLPMGLKNSPICFQLLINEVFHGILGNGVFAYLDDIIVVSQDMETHFQRLNDVLARLAHAGLKVKLSKCNFLRKRLTFLGHVVDANGLHTSDDKVAAVKNFPRPETVKQLKSFLGLSGYYRPFVPHYATLSSPLLRLLKKDAPFIWRDEQEHAFNALKTALTTAPVLAFPNFQEPFILVTDASGKGLGAALMQRDVRNKNRPIAYASRILNNAESRYSVTDLETLAIVWALRHFRDLIYGYPITVYTDHQPVKDLFKGRNLTGRLARWMVILEDYRPTIEYLPGKLNVVADALSRSVTAAPLMISQLPSHLSEDTLMNAQRDHPLWGQVIDSLERDDVSSLPEIPVPSNQLSLQDGLLIRRATPCSSSRADTSQLVIPDSLVPQILNLVHDSVQAGHPGVDRTIRYTLLRYWWPSLHKDVTQHIAKCLSCARHKSHPSYPVPMREYPVPERPWDTIAVDLLKLPLTTTGYQYLFVCVDHFSRFIILAPLRDKSASSVARVLVDKVINPFTTPKVILSDNGAEFRNDLLAEVCQAFNTKQTFIVAHHPASNGLVERANRKILEALRHVTSGFAQVWDNWLSHIAASINASYNSSINESPHYVLFGEDKRLPYDLLLSKPQPIYNVENFAKVMLSSFQRIHQSVKVHLRSSNSQALARQHSAARPVKFQVGDIVLLVNLTRDSKLAPRNLGPYRIIARSGNKFTIRDFDTHEEITVHASHLRKASPDLIPASPHDETSVSSSRHNPRGKFPSPPSHPYSTRSRKTT